MSNLLNTVYVSVFVNMDHFKNTMFTSIYVMLVKVMLEICSLFDFQHQVVFDIAFYGSFLIDNV